ncbi:MAG: hypothetical protein PHY47_18550 [Lachnospiraceae bacterium]|nr:hypothetical protein [Lachnospiraceae bacterium]
MSKENPGVIFDASSSWNGYNHQGKLAIWFALQQIESVYNTTLSFEDNKSIMDNYFLEIEYLEDFSIGRYVNGKEEYITVHQVKNHDTTVASNYNSAFLGLAYHVKCIHSIQKAYLHTTKQVDLDKKTVEEYIKSLIENPNELIETLTKINEIRNDKAKREEALIVRKGRPPVFICKLKKALFDNNPLAEKLDDSNIDEACNKLEDEVNSQLAAIRSMPDELIKKIEIFTYDFGHTKQNFCEVNRLKALVMNKIENTIPLMGLKSYWSTSNFIERRYVCLLGHLDEHIIERNLNFPLYKDGTLERKIRLSQILEWLVSDEIDAQDDEFYHYFIKEKFLETANKFCNHCTKNEEECCLCLVTSVLNKIGSLSFDEMKKFLLLTNPNNNRGLSMITYPEYANSDKIADPFLLGVRDISILFDDEKTAITYTDMNTLQYVLTTITLNSVIDDIESICSDIVENRSLYNLLMDCDCFISKNMDVHSVVQEAMKIGKAYIENRDNEDKSSEHIAHLKRVKLISLGNFCKEVCSIEEDE